MKILKSGKLRKWRYYYGVCDKCGCEFSVRDDEVSVNTDYRSSDYGYFYVFCPNKQCHSSRLRSTVRVYSKKR